ncbi:GtrA family protein [Amycolatopsis sp. CA-230715]|uniref:GtrA family protein n=1 Tax=Amycolatopsis sp. CA-230715 TaxID=2745196 RepID=UPI001C036E9C|nr:GtrA family protein [Amycolatopsis sp. CA-230715]QWF78260.1 hypothetical protein HUW46_01655 [Amycolatopsis sp. CA-230715]
MTTARWVGHHLPHRQAPAARRRHHRLGEHLVLYVVAGGVTTAMQAGLFLLLRPWLDSVLANLAAIAVTTAVNTEFHRRVTFADSESTANWRRVQSVLTFAFYAGYGSVVLTVLQALVVSPSANLEAVVLAVASTLGGLARFVLLRWWVFTRHTPRT